MRFFKILLLCIAVPVIIAFVLCILLPLFLLFLLISAIFAPHRIKGTFQQIHFPQKPEAKPSEGDEIDVECTVLDSQEIGKEPDERKQVE